MMCEGIQESRSLSSWKRGWLYHHQQIWRMMPPFSLYITLSAFLLRIHQDPHTYNNRSLNKRLTATVVFLWDMPAAFGICDLCFGKMEDFLDGIDGIANYIVVWIGSHWSLVVASDRWMFCWLSNSWGPGTSGDDRTDVDAFVDNSGNGSGILHSARGIKLPAFWCALVVLAFGCTCSIVAIVNSAGF
jgi:hypothetical protein